MDRVAIVGVDHVARRASAGAEVAGLVVRTHERQVRVVEPGLVNVEKRQVDPVQSAEAAIGEAVVRPAGILELVREADEGRGGAVEPERPPSLREVASRLANW